MNLLFFTSHMLKQIKNTTILLISRAIAWTAYSLGRLCTPIVNPSYSSDSLTLRPFKSSDARDLLNCLCDHQTIKFVDVETMTTEDEALDFITNNLMLEPWTMSICMNDCSVGWVSIYDHQGHKADLDYCLARKYWGQGIGTQVVKMAVNMVLKESPEIVRLGAFVDFENIGSQRVLEKNGFKKHGIGKIMFMKKGLFEAIRYRLEVNVVV